MSRQDEARRKERRLRWLFGLLFIGLALPAALLIRQGFTQIELAEFRRQQLIAEDLVRGIDDRLADAIRIENARPATDFDYAVTTPGDAGSAGNVVQLSPLSSLAAADTIPGTLGYFQVDASDRLSTPLLPESDRGRVPAAELRASLQAEIADVLQANRLAGVGGAGLEDGPEAAEAIAGPPTEEAAERARVPAFEPGPDAAAAAAGAAGALSEASETGEAGAADGANAANAANFERALADNEGVRGQAKFDELARVGELAPTGAEAAAAADADEAAYADEAAELDDADEAVVVTGSRIRRSADTSSRADVSVSAFAGDLEPLRFSLLETGHFVLFRNAWRGGERFVQGLLIDPSSFIDDSFERVFDDVGLAAGTRVTVAVAGSVAASLETGEPLDARVDASPLYETRLSPPLADIEIAFESGVLGRGPGFNLLVWTSLALFGVLVGGFVAMYRFGVQQMRLAQQQQKFVSAVSHELKTPLTSIRMYGEMLKSGWADDGKKQQYYDYIFDEGERLSRLIDNVLKVARLNKGEPAVSMESIAVGELFDVLRSKLASQTERAGFTLEVEVEPSIADESVSADVDGLIQVFINLVDNAIKFSKATAARKIVITARRRDADSVVLAVRDFGPGIPAREMKRLFELFYRPDNELTRTTAGTGIGLALVKQLVTAMSGRVDVRNAEPGAEFRLLFSLESKLKSP